MEDTRVAQNTPEDSGIANQPVSRRKRKATSCTTCRQAKLKCDLGAQYPLPCTRCAHGKSECKTDPSFRRVLARGRIQELEQQVIQLKQTRSPRPNDASTSELQVIVPSSSESIASSVNLQQSGSIHLVASGPTTSAWLRINNAELHGYYSLGEVTLQAQDVVVLFRHFEDLYYPHFSIIAPVTSLEELAQHSKLLFWTIVLVAAQHHVTYYALFDNIRAAHSRLYGQKCLEAVQLLSDLQAMLMLCTWPFTVRSQQKDPSWMQLGMVINAARSMGIDKVEEEDLFGGIESQYPSGNSRVSVRRMTWLKIFELDIQLSLWRGHAPTLSVAQNIHIIRAFCADPDVPRSYAACIEVYIDVSLYLDTLSHNLTGPVSTSLIRQYRTALEETKVRCVEASWTVHAEIALLCANLYLDAIPLVTFRRSGQTENTSKVQCAIQRSSALEALQTARLNAVKLAEVLAHTSHATVRSPSASGHRKETRFMPGYPKHFSLLAYFTGIVLLKYLDSVGNGKTAEAEEARNAFSTVFQLFKSCPKSPEHLAALGNLELAGRAIGNGQAQLVECVTSRMGASLTYNVIWTAGTLRGKEKAAAVSSAAVQVDRSSIPGPVASSNSNDERGPAESQQQPQQQPYTSDQSLAYNDMGIASMPVIDPQQSTAYLQQNLNQTLEFPFGAWDDAVYDNLTDSDWMDIALDWNHGGQ